MRIQSIPAILSLALLVGCAKNSEILALKSQIADLQRQESEAHAESEKLQQRIEAFEKADAEREAAVHAIGERNNKSNEDIFSLIRENLKRLGAVESRLELNADIRRSAAEQIKECRLKLVELEGKVEEFGARHGDTLDSDDSLVRRVDRLEHKVGFIDQTFRDQLWGNAAVYGPDPESNPPVECIHLVTRKY